MLIQGIWYFPLLAAMVATYWRLPHRATLRLGFLSSMSGVVLAYLLWRNLDNRIVLALIGTFAAISLTSYAIGTRLARYRSRAWLGIGLALPLFVLLLTHWASRGLGPLRAGYSLVIPISMGFFMLRQAHFVYECYRGGIRAKPCLIEFLTYVVFFPSIIAGPLERFPNFAGQVRNAFSWAHVSGGVERIIIGCFKKIILADVLIGTLLPPAGMAEAGFAGASWGATLFACAVKFLQVYFDFSGYTDIALGTARLFGFRLMENFNYPLLRPNLAEFWRAWNISLSTFARDYVYFPLLAKYRNTVFALVATMLAIAAWHGTSPGWILWGLHHGIGLALLARFQRTVHKIPGLQGLRATPVWRILGTLATWLFVTYPYALTWHPNDVALSLEIYTKLWSFGLWS